MATITGEQRTVGAERAAEHHGPKSAIAWIERQEWLEPAADALHQGVHRAYGAGGAAGRKIKDAMHGTWLGHPLHPVLTDFPIGAWSAALLLDFLDSQQPRRGYGRGADAAIACGLAGAATAAVTGLTDWSETDGRARRAGLVHGLLNVAATALYATSLAVRRRGRRQAGRGLALAGYALSFASAYIGGNLVYSKQIGVDHATPTELPADFEPVLSETELREGEPRRVEVRGQRIVLVRQHDRIHALAEVCSHLGGPLAEGAVEEGAIRCPWHGSCFALEDGRVLEGPSAHPQPCLDARVRDGVVEVRARVS
jgi:nitrite reductase/ring-hydroxylating ferredoxin subunit/uncharacterized membrane protein